MWSHDPYDICLAGILVNEIPAIGSIRHSCLNALVCLMSWVLPAAKLEFLGIFKAGDNTALLCGFKWYFRTKLELHGQIVL